MIKLTLTEMLIALEDLLKPSQPTLDTSITFEGVSIDTRTLQAGNLYVAIRGENLDGHIFVADAEKKGAVALLVDQAVDSPLPQILVENTCKALGQLAHYWRKKFHIPFIGITGSVGKTTTKQMVASILSQVGSTLFSEGNKNNYYGVPLTLFQLNEKHEYAVIEMGADKAGEITYLANIVEPDIGLITMIAGVHLVPKEGVGFGTLEGVFEEKTQLFAALKPEGTAIMNADDSFYERWCTRFPALHAIHFGKQGQVRADNLNPNENLQYAFDLITPKGNIRIQLSAIGQHNVENALAAAAAALALNLSLTQIKQGLENIPSVNQRMVMHRLSEGALLIDDSYNANVRSVPAVMETLAQFAGTRIMIFGDMLEIGPTSAEEHRKIGEKARALSLDYFFAYGTESLEAVKAFGENGQHFATHAELVEALKPLLQPKTVLAVKGSRGMKLEKVVEALR